LSFKQNEGNAPGEESPGAVVFSGIRKEKQIDEAHVETALAELEAALGHVFVARELLVRALTHRSLAKEQAALEHQYKSGMDTAGEARLGEVRFDQAGDNERLEFLGDAVLGLVVAESLFKVHPDWHEGELTRVRAQLVSRQHMARVGEAIGLGRHLRLSRGEDKSGLRRKSTVLSNTMEAVIGALFLDGGLEPVRVFARHHVLGEAAEQLAEELRSGAALGNYKSALQERLQAERAGTPVYRVKGESGPGHRKRFLVEVRLKKDAGEPGKPLARGTGSTKKHAEQDAARRALEHLAAAAARAGEVDRAQPGGIEEEAAQ
jgi:ribonuclease III